MICAHSGGTFHALRVHPSQILELRFQPRPNFAFLVGWGAPWPISWSSQSTSMTGIVPRWNIGPQPGQWGGCLIKNKKLAETNLLISLVKPYAIRRPAKNVSQGPLLDLTSTFFVFFRRTKKDGKRRKKTNWRRKKTKWRRKKTKKDEKRRKKTKFF